jgi:hypothetical protein
MVLTGARGFGWWLVRGRGQAVVVAAVLLGAGLVAPAVAGASVDTVVVSVSNHAPGVNGSFAVTARAINSSGRTDTSFNGPAAWSDKSGDLNVFSPSDFVNGVATTNAAVSVPFHNDHITVLVPGGLGLSGTSGQFNVIGPLDHFSFSPELHTEAINTAFTLKIYARDAAGNLLTGYGGSPSWADASGSLSPSSPAAFSGGVSTNASTQIADPAHLDKITVSDAGVESSSHAFDVLGPFDHFTFSKLSSVATNQPFKLVVRAVDSAGNIVTGYGGSPSWSDTTKSLGPYALPAAFVDGVSVNRCTTVGSPDSSDQITVDDTSANIQTTSPEFNVTGSQVFSTPGTYTFSLQCGANITATAIGAPGGIVSLAGLPNCDGNGPIGGPGASVTASLAVPAGEQLTAGVGGVGGEVSPPNCTTGGAGGTGSGLNGGAGGSGNFDGGAGGGGASFLSTGTGSPTTNSLLLVGAGGGGDTQGAQGGEADQPGSLQPPNCPFPDINDQTACGGGAGTSAGTPPDVGTGGVSDGQPGDTTGSDGGFLTGGAGGSGAGGSDGFGGGGGGGGYYGGGGGGGGGLTSGGGGGGESYIASSTTNPSGPTADFGHAEVSITYMPAS